MQVEAANNGTAPRASPTKVTDFDPLHVGSSVQTCRGLAVSAIRTKTALFNRLLGQLDVGAERQVVAAAVARRTRDGAPRPAAEDVVDL